MAFKAVISEGTKYKELYLTKLRSKGVKVNGKYTEPLPYTMDEYRVLMIKNPQYTMHPAYDTAYRNGENARASLYDDVHRNDAYISSNTKNTVHNKALDKVADKLEYVSNLFEAWYERREAYTLLGQCIRSVHTFFKRWKDPQYWRQMRKTFKTKTKDPSSVPEAWLLWQFALKPLIMTIDDIINLLSQDLPILWVEGASGVSETKDVTRLNHQNEGYEMTYKYTYIVKHGVRVKSLNPNAQLLNIMGATTPISSYLSVVPWFWAVNYFVNINAVISNLEVRFPGVNVDKTYTTTFLTTLGYGDAMVMAMHSKPIVGSSLQHRDHTRFWHVNASIVKMKRTVSTSVPPYKLALSYPKLGSNQFANLTSAIALIVKGAAQK